MTHFCRGYCTSFSCILVIFSLFANLQYFLFVLCAGFGVRGATQALKQKQLDDLDALLDEFGLDGGWINN